jgi:protein AaeX
MIGDFNLYGIYIPSLLLTALLSMGAARVLSYGMARIGLYRYVWHPALFDFSLFIIVLGLNFMIFSAYGF